MADARLGWSVLFCCLSIAPASAQEGAKKSEQPQAMREIVPLNAREIDIIEEKSDGGILVRELVRQAILIAARDGLGIATRDRVLREPFPRQTSDAFTSVHVETEAVVGKHLR